MKALKIVTPIFIIVIALMITLLPIGPVPGFFIGGTETSVPATWADTSSIHEIRLKVENGSLPRVVNIWVIQLNGDLHVVGASDSGWVVTLGTGGPVQIRMGDATYALNAALVTDGWQSILEAYQDKYRPDYPEIVDGFPTIEEAAGTISVFTLSRKQS